MVLLEEKAFHLSHGLPAPSRKYRRGSTLPVSGITADLTVV